MAWRCRCDSSSKSEFPSPDRKRATFLFSHAFLSWLPPRGKVGRFCSTIQVSPQRPIVRPPQLHRNVIQPARYLLLWHCMYSIFVPRVYNLYARSQLLPRPYCYRVQKSNKTFTPRCNSIIAWLVPFWVECHL